MLRNTISFSSFTRQKLYNKEVIHRYSTLGTIHQLYFQSQSVERRTTFWYPNNIKKESRIGTRRNENIRLFAAPKRGSIVDTYRSVDVLCTKCQTKLFKYKKKNGTKSKLVKMYIERIVDDPYNLLNEISDSDSETTGKISQVLPDSNSLSYSDLSCTCPKCKTKFGRSSFIKGLPAIAIVGGKLRMK